MDLVVAQKWTVDYPKQKRRDPLSTRVIMEGFSRFPRLGVKA